MSTSPTSLAPERARPRKLRRHSRLGASLTALAIAFGTTVSANNAAFAAPANDSPTHSDARIDKSLNAMAKLFARAVTDENLRQQIHDGAAQRFDGDTNVLYATLSNTSGVRQALAAAYSRARTVQPGDALRAVDRLADDIPRFQVAVPVKFDSWDPASYTPLVAYMPVGVEDTELETITAYDATGRTHELAAQVDPAQPVIVLGLNERTNDAGTLLQQQPVSSSQMTAMSGAYNVRMVKVHLIRDHEPWAKGDAEISLRAKGCGLGYTDINWTSLNDDGDWWYGPRFLGQTTCYGIFYWWEDDGSSWDFTLSYKGVSLNVKMDDGDDLIGGVKLLHGKFYGGSNDKVEWSSLVQWTD